MIDSSDPKPKNLINVYSHNWAKRTLVSKELLKYPFGKNWTVLVSKKSWLQDHIHYLLFERTKKPNIMFEFNLMRFELYFLFIKLQSFTSLIC